MELSTIYEPIHEDLLKVKDSVRSLSKVDFPWLSKLLSHSLVAGGKEIRPALTLLSGKFYDYKLELLLPMAMAVELLHTATLIHDDAIDDSAIRRGRPTVNSLWGRDKAVLLGDYLFAKAGECAATTQNLRVIMLFSQTLETISSGELNQIFDAFNLKQTREHYLRRIARKTASLFSLATESGAVLSQTPEELVQVLKEYGRNLGIAFQIVDDVLDFIGTEEELGKPVGSDLAQGTLTLPAALLLKRHPRDNPVKELFSNRDMPERDRQENIKRAIELIRDPSIINECYSIASDYCSMACQDFDSLPDNASREALKALADFVVSRKR